MPFSNADFVRLSSSRVSPVAIVSPVNDSDRPNPTCSMIGEVSGPVNVAVQSVS